MALSTKQNLKRCLRGSAAVLAAAADPHDLGEGRKEDRKENLIAKKSNEANSRKVESRMLIIHMRLSAYSETGIRLRELSANWV